MKKKIIFGILGIAILILAIAGYYYWRKYEPIIGVEWFQTGNTQLVTRLQTKKSQELEDNRIGGLWGLRTPDHYGDSPKNLFVILMT